MTSQTSFHKATFSATLDQLSNLLSQKVDLISEFCKLEEKIQLGEQQISALDQTEMYNRL